MSAQDMTGTEDRIHRRPLERRTAITGDAVFRVTSSIATLAAVLLICLMIYKSVVTTFPVIGEFGVIGFTLGSRWSPSCSQPRAADSWRP